jgi:hypothetical protein
MSIEVTASNAPINVSASGVKVEANVTGGQGPQGPAATITVGTVTTGAPGSSVSVTNSGTSGSAVLNFTIPAGADGATGPQGPAGPAGSNATATTDASQLVTGTLPDARLSANIARTSDVSAAVAAVVDAAPASLDTLKELAAALGNDASFATTVTNTLATKAPINNPTFTGTVGGITKSMVGLGNVDNTSDANKPVSTAQAAADAAVASAAAVDATSKANAAQAAAVQRANHTGTQTASTISDFNTAASAAAPVQSVAGRTGAVTIAAADVSGLGSLATASSVAYSDVTGKPSSFTPSAHKTSHATGGSDALSPSDIGAAAASHTHSASDITSGTIDTLRLPASVVYTFDARLTDPRTPTGSAGGSLSGTYPNPGIAAGAVGTSQLSDGSVTSAKLSPLLTPADIGAASSSHVHSGADITSGTVPLARLPVRVRVAANIYLWSSFR